MNKDRELMQLALEALEEIHPGNMTPMAEEAWNKAITAIREALAEQPAQQQMPDDWFKGMPEEYRRAAWRAIWRAAQPLPDFSPIFGNTKENT